jgi:hypothetical protein
VVLTLSPTEFQCRTMDELLDLTFDWFATRTHFRVQSTVYRETLGKRAILPQLAGGI